MSDQYLDKSAHNCPMSFCMSPLMYVEKKYMHMDGLDDFVLLYALFGSPPPNLCVIIFLMNCMRE